MKKLIVKLSRFILFFTIFFILINVLYVWIIASTDWDVIKRIESLKLHDPDYELLVLGASGAMDAVDTEMLTENKIKSYNMGLGGNTVRTCYIQLNEYLTKYAVKPHYVLLGVNSIHESFSNDGIQPIVDFTMKDHHFTLKDVPILKFKWLGFEFLKKIVSKAHREAGLSDGQLKFQRIKTDNTNYNRIYLDISKFESSIWMGEIAKLCSLNEIELIVLDLPGYREIQNLSSVGPYKLSFSNGYSGYLYNFNFRDFCMVFENDKDWIGNSHLNERGALKFTRELFVNKIIKPKPYTQ